MRKRRGQRGGEKKVEKRDREKGRMEK